MIFYPPVLEPRYLHDHISDGVFTALKLLFLPWSASRSHASISGISLSPAFPTQHYFLWILNNVIEEEEKEKKGKKKLNLL